MGRLIVLDDKNCRKELNSLLTKHKKNVHLDTSNSAIAQKLTTITNFDRVNINNNERIVINTANTSILVRVEDIIRCQSNRNYTELFLNNGNKITVSKPLKKFEELKPLKNFARVHLSHLVNVNYIDRFIKSDGGSLLLTNGESLPVSKRRRDEWVQKLEII